jgi:hypothetical protein
VTSSAEAYSENARLEALERDNRRLQRFGALLIMGMAVVIALGVVLVYTTRSVATEVSARSFVLRDATGAVRGLWAVAQDSTLRFVLNDGSAGVSLVDSAGRARAVFALDATDGRSSVVLADAAGRTRSVLGVSADGSANVVFADQNGTTRAGLGVNPLGLGTFTLADLNRRAPAPAEEDTTLPDSAPAPAPRRR